MHTCVTLLFQLGPQPGRGLCPGDSQSASCELALQSQPHPHSGSRLLSVAQGTWPEGHGDAMSTDTEHRVPFLPGPPSARAGCSWEKPQHVCVQHTQARMHKYVHVQKHTNTDV